MKNEQQIRKIAEINVLNHYLSEFPSDLSFYDIGQHLIHGSDLTMNLDICCMDWCVDGFCDNTEEMVKEMESLVDVFMKFAHQVISVENSTLDKK